MIAIQHNNATIAIARNEDVVECHDEDTADTLRAEGYLPIGDGATSRPATPEECDRYTSWLNAGRAHQCSCSATSCGW